MAVKKTEKKKDVSASPTKPAAKDSAKTTSKKPAATKAAPAATKASSTSGSAASTGSASASAPTKTSAPKSTGTKAPKAKAAPVKLTASQQELLKKVHGAGEGGYSAEKKVEERSLTALLDRKLIKKGAKDKQSGKVPHTLSAAGKKHMEQSSSGSSSPTA